jgi:hypothetical protein
MSADMMTEIEKDFLSLPREERDNHPSWGCVSAVRFEETAFPRREQVRDFEEKYKTTLDQLDMKGLPTDAGYEMHEDYIMWHHWQTVCRKIKQDIEPIQKIAQYGYPSGVDFFWSMSLF